MYFLDDRNNVFSPQQYYLVLLVMKEYDWTLWDLLKKTNPTPQIRLKLVSTILEPVMFIQRKNFAHLDLKPANVFIGLIGTEWDGSTLVIGDFGISSKRNSSAICQSGTPGFSSPEQFVGRPSSKSDNYAFGKVAVLTLFEWNTAWNLLAQPIKKGAVSEVERNLKPLHQLVSGLLHVR